MIRGKKKIFFDQSFFLTLLLVEIITFWITKNQISKVVVISHLLIIISLLIYFIANINFSKLKLKIKKNRSILFYFTSIIFFYLTNINYSAHLNISTTCKNINSVISIFIDCSYSIFFFYFILIFFFLIFFKIKLKFDLTKIFTCAGLVMIVISFINLIIYYLSAYEIISNLLTSKIIPFGGNYHFYFQLLPFAAGGKRNDEILIYALAYVAVYLLYLRTNERKFKYLIVIIFTTCFLTYSKNLWLNILLTNFILVFIYRKNKIFLTKILKTFFLSVIGLIITISTIFLWQLKSDEYFGIKKNNFHYSSIISYTVIRFGFELEPNNFNKYEKIIFNNNIDKITYELKNNKILNEVDKIKLQEQLDAFQKRLMDSSKNTSNVNYLFNSNPERIFIYKTVFSEIKKFDIKEFFLGKGLNSISIAIQDKNYKSAANTIIVNSESQILQIIYEIGLIGFFLYWMLIVKFLKILDTERKVILISILTLCIFNSYQDSTLYAALIGIILGLNNNKLNTFKMRKNLY
jgi:hypothetical protein